MKITPVIFASAAVMALMSAPASATDIKQLCETTITADGGDPSGCGCLADKAAGDADIATNIEEIAGLPAEERAGASSEATGAAIAACFPQAAG